MFFSAWENRWVNGRIEYCGNYYLEVIEPNLFEPGSVRLFEHAHPNSLSRDHLLKTGSYEELEDMRWALQRYGDPQVTLYGDF